MEQAYPVKIKIINDRNPRNGATGTVIRVLPITDQSKSLYNYVCFKVQFDDDTIEYFPVSETRDYIIWGENPNNNNKSPGPLK